MEYFVKEFAAKRGGSDQERAETAEKAKRLLQKAPGNLRSHDHVSDWINQNWDA